MGELGDLFEAMHASRSSYRTLRAEYRLWRHEELASAAWDAAVPDDGSVAVITAVSREPAPSESAAEWRVWVERPDSVRSEFSESSFGLPVGVQVGARWWIYSEEMGAQTNEREGNDATDAVNPYAALLEPARTLGLLEFEPRGWSERVGRRVLRCRATPVPSGDSSYEFYSSLAGLQPTAAAYELEVDAQRGVLLRVEARHDDKPFFIAEARTVAFDEPIPEDTFVFRPPEGEEIRSLNADPPALSLSIDQAAARAPFAVFVPSRVPDDWELSVSYFQGDERMATPDTVALGYRSADGTASVSINQYAAGQHERDDVSTEAPPLELIERDGHTMEVRSRTPDWPQSTLETTRDGTEIWMTSMDLPGETLVELATRLVPARSGPPRI